MSDQSNPNTNDSHDENPIARIEPRLRTKKLRCCSGRVADLTGTGMRLLVSSAHKPEIGDIQTYTFNDENHCVEIAGTVRWVSDAQGFSRKCQVGVQFNEIAPSVREALVRLAVQGNLGEPGKQIGEVEVKYPDLYELLRVSAYANEDEIRKAYHLEARRWHPDLNDSPDAATQFETLTKAYEVLRDPQLRARYDERFGTERAA